MAFALSGIVLVLLCASISLFIYFLFDDSPRPLPRLYHNAQDLTETLVERDGPASDLRVVTFLTPDPVDVVHRFYDDSMRWSRWPSDGCDQIDGAYRCSYVQRLDGPSRSVLIEIETTENKMTKVTLEMSSFGAGWNGSLPSK